MLCDVSWNWFLTILDTMSSRRTRRSTRAAAGTLDHHSPQTHRRAAAQPVAPVAPVGQTKRQRTTLTEHKPNVPAVGRGKKKKKAKKGAVGAQQTVGVRTRSQRATNQENASDVEGDDSESEDAEDEEEEDDSKSEDAEDEEESNASSIASAPTINHEEPEVSAAEKITSRVVEFPEGVTDIFVHHRNSHRYCSDYSDDVYFHLRAQETKTVMRSCYIGDVQYDVTADMRAILVDWLVMVAQKFNFAPLTLHYCVRW